MREDTIKFATDFWSSLKLFITRSMWRNPDNVTHRQLLYIDQLHSSMCLISGTVRSTPLPWLPVLTNIEPPALRCRAATYKLIMQAECHRDWPLYDDVFHPLPLRLESHKPLWRDL